MSDMLEVLSMMAAPATVLLALRWYVLRQNRAAAAAEQNSGAPPL
ncbi:MULTISPECIES: hypothetical protein [unclassified Mycolicibacterium]|nr:MULTISPECIES: hypothetical protein [unclassified Mycolicibacterium]